MEQDTIRARSIEPVNERGERGFVLEGGGWDKEPGLVVYGPGGQSAVAIIVRREDEVPVLMATSAAGTAIQATFDPDGTSMVNVRDTDGEDRMIVVEMDPDDITDGQPWLTLEFSSAASELFVGVVGVLVPVFKQKTPPTAIA